jgi:hypothetical protein
MIIICQHGHIAPAGGDWLWASTHKPRSKQTPTIPKKWADKLFALAQEDNSLKVKQDGDDGLAVEFHTRDFRAVANILQPKGV